ncbi:type VII secretion integral membrane protein EccD [Solwaraspora sp. WMMD791]|uniref:type VII secretion integral membrane protein EccD n=1 Tax=Solwaraspora sp. WMMD791 TaxID=3016086 RepID=UPI00249C0E7D|nr:type VII secretion integral membrane protein EccD [Solwaraspora sp. WMMD791]WFE26236.1 type VII secretion integral membrane protein EccD [Solwaraspora sp. WMMD791]
MSVRLAKITVCGPRRRLDLALPAHVPVAEWLPEVLRRAGDGLADEGERHGGWMLCRTDGTPVSATRPLPQQGVRDGEVLHLVPGDTFWPEPEHDDLADLVAATSRSRRTPWSGQTTRRYACAAAAVWLAGGWLLLVRLGGPDLAELAVVVTVAAAVAGVLADRVWRDPVAGLTLGASALPYAFAAGLLLAGGDGPVGTDPHGWPSAGAVLAAHLAMLVAAPLIALGVTTGRSIFTAATTVGLLGSLTAAVALAGAGAAGAAAVALALVGCGTGLLPRLAVRIGRLPVTNLATGLSGVTTPDATTVGTSAPEPDAVAHGVVRAEQVLTGMLVGFAVLAVVASTVLVWRGGVAGLVLLGAAAVALPLRCRMFVVARQRVPLQAAGLTAAVLLVLVGLPAYLPLPATGFVVLAAALALTSAAAGSRYATRVPSPYLGRAADVLDTLAVVSLIPVAGAVLGLYRWATGLLG